MEYPASDSRRQPLATVERIRAVELWNAATGEGTSSARADSPASDDERADPVQLPPARTNPWQLRFWAR